MNWSTKGDLLVHVTAKAGVDLAYTPISPEGPDSGTSDIACSLETLGGLSLSRNFFFFFFGCTETVVSDQELNLGPWQWDRGVLITGPPGNYPVLLEIRTSRNKEWDKELKERFQASFPQDHEVIRNLRKPLGKESCLHFSPSWTSGHLDALSSLWAQSSFFRCLVMALWNLQSLQGPPASGLLPLPEFP